MSDSQTTSQAADIRDRHGKYLWPSVANFYQEPLVLESGKGLYLKDIDGREFLDFFGGILTVSIGHCDDRITSAIKTQVDRLGHVSTLYPTVPIVELAERMARITPGNLQKSYFTASGTEADETAFTLAQVHTGAMEIIALRHGYSGRSMLAQSLTAHGTWRAVPSQIAAVKHAPNPYCYRCPLGLEYPSCNIKCADDIEAVIQTTTTGNIAGFLAEPIQGVGGFVVPPPEYFERAVGIIRKYGGLFICDEVQTGFARTGGKMFGIEHWGVQPDIMTMAKGVANGMPLGVTIATPEIADSFQKLQISTFGGNPISCAAANATLDIIEGEDYPKQVEAKGNYLQEGLKELQREFPKIIGDVRGKGLMQAIEFVVDEPGGDRTPNPQAVGSFLEETKKQGVLVGKGGFFGNVLRISPPMSIENAQIDDALKMFRAALTAMEH